MRWPGDFPALFAFLCMCLWSLLCVLDMLGSGLLQLQRAFLSFVPQTCLPVRVKGSCSLYIHGPHGCARYFLGWFAALFIFPWAGWFCTSTYMSFPQALKAWFCSFAALFWFPFMCLLLLHNQISHAVFFPPAMYAWCLARIIVQLYLHFFLALVRVSVQVLLLGDPAAVVESLRICLPVQICLMHDLTSTCLHS